ncbi:MAG: 30S ribosomal protein S6 [Candidatus Neomarinimicrobiota bacterium]
MRYYESLYIVNPNYEQERLDDVMKSVADKLSEYGFSIINHRIWGKKRLAYPIEKHKYGSFILLHFETESTENLERFERFMILQKTILRNQTVSLAIKPEAHVEDEPVKDEEQKESADDSSVASETKEKSNVESEEDSEVKPVIEEEIVVETEEMSAQNEETEEKVELAIEEETTEEVQE